MTVGKETQYYPLGKTEIQKVKERIYETAFQEQEVAFRPTDNQTALLIRKNDGVLQEDIERGSCGRTKCTSRSKCFRTRYKE